MIFICFNGAFLPESEPVITTGNTCFKWGEGIFETMKVLNGSILLKQFHFERLFLSLKLLGIGYNTSFNEELLSSRILQLCKKNNCLNAARVRLAVFRNEDEEAGYAIEAIELPSHASQWNKKGWSVDIYPFARKSGDAFGNLKTANFLPYVLASRYARQNGLDDALVLNTENHIADSSRANIFLIKDGELFTPALHQACVNGVMRRFLIQELKQLGMPVHQQQISEQQLLEADEVFLTNAIYGMRWVSSFREKTYGSEKVRSVYDQVFSTIYS